MSSNCQSRNYEYAFDNDDHHDDADDGPPVNQLIDSKPHGSNKFL